MLADTRTIPLAPIPNFHEAIIQFKGLKKEKKESSRAFLKRKASKLVEAKESISSTAHDIEYSNALKNFKDANSSFCATKNFKKLDL